MILSLFIFESFIFSYLKLTKRCFLTNYENKVKGNLFQHKNHKKYIYNF